MARKTEVAEATIGKAEARKLVDAGKKAVVHLVEALMAIKYRFAWLALDYKSEAKCLEREFGRTTQWARETLETAEFNQRYLPPPSGPKGASESCTLSPGMGTKAVQELKKVPEEHRAAVASTALNLAEAAKRPGVVIPADIGRAKDLELGPEPEEEEPEEEAPGEPVCDAEGNPVSEAARALFADHAAYKEIMAAYRALRKKWEELEGRPSARAMNVSCHKTLIGFALKQTRQAIFDVSCPGCEGKGCKHCWGWGGLLPNRSVKEAENLASEEQIKYIYEAFEKKGRRYALTALEARRRLDLFVAQYRLKKPTGCRPLQCPFKKKKGDFILGSQADGEPLVDW